MESGLECNFVTFIKKYLDSFERLCQYYPMIVDESTEQYLIHSMGLTKEQIEEMLPSEIKKHCDEVIRKEIDALGMYKPAENGQKS